MAGDPLEAKINKIRQQNEEIRRRYEEVEADKKNAAKSNALVQMVPSTDWPERKEPPEISSPPLNKTNSKPRNPTRDHNGGSIQYRIGGEGKKIHTFPQNEGPPPDPKYNFLADSERDEHHENLAQEVDKNKARGKPSRPYFKRRGDGREWQTKEYRGKSGAYGQDPLPDYDAWRAERNKIDEARISRQRTAEGNWKREWDNDKMHLADDTIRENHTLGDAMRPEPGEDDRHSRGQPRNSSYSHGRESDHDRRIINSSEKNSQVAVKNPLMSVKVSSPNIVGTGRVGPRQRSRMMYSSQSEREFMNFEVGNFTVQQSPEEKSKSNNFGNATKSSTKSFNPQRRNDSNKSPHPLRREHEGNDSKFHKRSEVDVKSSSFNNKDFRNFQQSPHIQRRNTSTYYQSKSPGNNEKFGQSWDESMMMEPRSSEINETTTPIEVTSVPEAEKDQYAATDEKNPSDNEASSPTEEIIIENVEVPVQIVETLGESQVVESQNSENTESFESSCDQANNYINNHINTPEKSHKDIKNVQGILNKEDEIKIQGRNSQEERELNVLHDDTKRVIDNVNTPKEMNEEITAAEVAPNNEDSKK